MQYARTARSWRIGIMAAMALLALAWLASAPAQSQPPLRLYGNGTAGDMIRVSNEAGDELGTTRVASSGEWHIDIDCHADKVNALSFALNGALVDVRVSVTGADQARVAFLGTSEDADEMSEDEELLEDGLTSEDDESADGDITEDLPSDDAMSDDESADGDITEDLPSDDVMSDGDVANGTGMTYPDSGTGGLLDQGASTTRIALWIAAVAAAVAASLGIALQRRRRA